MIKDDSIVVSILVEMRWLVKNVFFEKKFAAMSGRKESRRETGNLDISFSL